MQRLSAAGDITLAFAAQPQPIRVGQHFVLQIWLCAPQGVDATLTRVDADMPAHRHGMNYRVTLEAQAGQRWRASGLMFHMPGRWRLQFDLSSAGRTQRLEHLLDLE